MPAQWDVIPAYDAPVESQYLMSAAVVTQVALGDPQRDTMIFGVAGPVTQTISLALPVPIAYQVQNINISLPVINVSTNPNMGPNNGLIVSVISNPLVLTFRKHGLVVTLPWYALGGGPATTLLTVITQRLRYDPDHPPTPNVLQEIDNGRFTWPFNRRAGRPGGAKLYGNSWVQRQKGAPFGIPYLDESGLAKPDGAGSG